MKHLDYFSLKMFAKGAKINTVPTFYIKTVPVFANFVYKIKFSREQRLDRVQEKNSRVDRILQRKGKLLRKSFTFVDL